MPGIAGDVGHYDFGWGLFAVGGGDVLEVGFVDGETLFLCLGAGVAHGFLCLLHLAQVPGVLSVIVFHHYAFCRVVCPLEIFPVEKISGRVPLSGC